jgi:hypothetical protein
MDSQTECLAKAEGNQNASRKKDLDHRVCCFTHRTKPAGESLSQKAREVSVGSLAPLPQQSIREMSVVTEGAIPSEKSLKYPRSENSSHISDSVQTDRSGDTGDAAIVTLAGPLDVELFFEQTGLKSQQRSRFHAIQSCFLTHSEPISESAHKRQPRLVLVPDFDVACNSTKIWVAS